MEVEVKDATLCFLVKKGKGGIDKILLAMKKRGFGANRWNGVGGKIDFEGGESIEDALIREAKEEIGVQIDRFYKVATIDFKFKYKTEFNQIVHAYFAPKWQGEPKESEEMKPKWFAPKDIPYKEMWPDDIFWVPKVISGKLLKAKFLFGKNDSVLKKDVRAVRSLQ
jgi:8-oxo-dGTP pyrophosphatase MutT (NUDIX family)